MINADGRWTLLCVELVLAGGATAGCSATLPPCGQLGIRGETCGSGDSLEHWGEESKMMEGREVLSFSSLPTNWDKPVAEETVLGGVILRH